MTGQTASTLCTHPRLLLIVPSSEGERQAEAMETWITACTDEEPFALELVGTAKEQGFVLRTGNARQQERLGKQIQAQYPEAELRPIAEGADPLMIREGEHAVIGEFCLTQKSYLPLKTFSGKALIEPGSDPLMGILAAMETVGPGARVICQLALCRAPDTWIAPDLRKAVEHPLQNERDQVHTKQQPSAQSGPGVLILLAMLGVLAVVFGRTLLHTLPVFL